MLDMLPITWNREKLKQTTLKKIPEHQLSRIEILELWNDLSEYNVNKGSNSMIHGYLKGLYNLPLDSNESAGWKIYQDSVEHTKDLNECIFKKLKDSSINDPNLTKSYILVITKGFSK